MLVLCLVSLMVVRVATPPFAWSGSGSDLVLGICLKRPGEVHRVYRLLHVVQEGCPCHGPVHALIANGRRISFR